MNVIEGYDIEVTEARQALVKELQEEIRADKKHFRDAFRQMQDDMETAWNGAVKAWPKKSYKVNITQRFVRQKVASLYAKNPRALAKRRQRMNFKVWDGQMQSLQMAMQGLPDPQTAMAVLTDVQNAKAQNDLFDKRGKSLAIRF